MNPISIKCPLCGGDIPLALILQSVRMDGAGVIVTWAESSAPHNCTLEYVEYPDPLYPDPTLDRVTPAD